MGNFSASPQLPPWTSTQAQSAFSSSTMLQMHGDVQDRFRVHTTPAPFRRWLSSGFPCQPLSTQGDMKGQLDPRSDVFYGTLRAAWEQQAGGNASLVQEQLAWSLGWWICQTTLHLHHSWPCKRSRLGSSGSTAVCAYANSRPAQSSGDAQCGCSFSAMANLVTTGGRAPDSH